MRNLITYFVFSFLLFATCTSAFGQNYKVLHYTETSSFDHRTRGNSFRMFNSFSGLSIIHDSTGHQFDTLSKLNTFDLIVFSNTSGSNILDSAQRSHFEQYMLNGGALL